MRTQLKNAARMQQDPAGNYIAPDSPPSVASVRTLSTSRVEMGTSAHEASVRLPVPASSSSDEAMA